MSNRRTVDECLETINKLQPGDIILTSKDSFIVKFMSIFQKDPVKYGHAMVVRDAVSVFESHWFIEINSLIKVLQKRKHYTIIRYKNITTENVEVIYRTLSNLVGKFYSFRRIFLQIFDHFFDTNWFTKLDKSPDSQVCSTLVAYSFHKALRYRFNDVDWKSCDPDDIHDESQKNPDMWEIIEVR